LRKILGTHPTPWAPKKDPLFNHKIPQTGPKETPRVEFPQGKNPFNKKRGKSSPKRRAPQKVKELIWEKKMGEENN